MFQRVHAAPELSGITSWPCGVEGILSVCLDLLLRGVFVFLVFLVVFHTISPPGGSSRHPKYGIRTCSSALAVVEFFEFGGTLETRALSVIYWEQKQRGWEPFKLCILADVYLIRVRTPVQTTITNSRSGNSVIAIHGFLYWL